jgi:hypothetical protein
MIAHLSIYDEIAEFIASMDPLKLIHFNASPSLQIRVDSLLEKNQGEGLTAEERSELEHYMVIDHLISLAKIRAQKMLNQSFALAS